MMSDQADQYAFEDSVRATARVLWDEAALSGAAHLEGRERDGVFETRDVIHIVEATVSTRKQKIVDDGKKTHDAVLKLRRNGTKFAQGWLITKSEPTADQRDVVKDKYSSTTIIMSFDQFRSRLFDGTEYLQLRSRHRFGSIQDFAEGTVHVPELDYVPVDFLDFDRTKSIPYRSVLWRGSGRQLYVLLGEYGSGKSMALREAFVERRKAYGRSEHMRCPVYLNLREHTGQNSPIEALERHARNVGYPGPASDLVRAWKAGFLDLFLDGFDEMATAGWGGSIQQVRTHRYAGMSLVRSFVNESPSTIDIYIAGRENFFDTPSELRKALGIGNGFAVVRTSEFGPDELKKFLDRKGYHRDLPPWLPARPLLISYLISKDLVGGIGESSTVDEARGWDSLLDMIATREASQDGRLSPDTVRQLLERLATLARQSVDGLGNLHVATIQGVFQTIAGFPPDEGAQQLLLRLPGLAPSSREDGTRTFADRSIADAAKAGDVFRLVQSPYGGAVNIFAGAISSMGALGKALLVAKALDANVTGGQVMRAAKIAADSDDSQQVCSDLLHCYMQLNDASKYDPFIVRSITEENLDFASDLPDISEVEFRQCVFSNVSVDADYNFEKLPRFSDCLIGTLSGVFSSADMPSRLSKSEITEVTDDIKTNADIFSTTLPEPTKVLVSVLRKLFLQSGAGRHESAFLRGAMDSRSRALVPDVLGKVMTHGFAHPTNLRGNVVWHPNRARSHEARSIIFSPWDPKSDLAKAVLRL